LLNKYLKCSFWRLALRYDIYIYIYMLLCFKSLIRYEYMIYISYYSIIWYDTNIYTYTKYEKLHKIYVKHLNCKLYYQQLHLKYLCNVVRYWLQAPWGWHDSVETCRSVIICEIIVHLLVIVQNDKRCMVQRIKINTTHFIVRNFLSGYSIRPN